MGPYMRPIPVGASAAMVFSLLVAFIVTPWAAVRLLQAGVRITTTARRISFTRIYRRIMDPLIASGRMRLAFLAGVAALLLAAMALVPLGLVTVKMLPFDNKSEFQVVIDMPEGTALEETARVASALAAAAARTIRRGQRAALRRHGGAVQLQRPRPALLPAPWSRTSADLQVNLVPQGRALGAEPRPSRGGCASGCCRSPRSRARRSRLPKCRPVLRSCRRSSPKSTDRTRRDATESRRRSSRSSSRRRAWSTPTGTSRRRSRRPASSWTTRRPRPPAYRPPPWPRSCGWPARARSAGLLHVEHAREDVPIVDPAPARQPQPGGASSALRLRGDAVGRHRRADADRAQHGDAEPLSQEPAAGDLRDRRSGRARTRARSTPSSA